MACTFIEELSKLRRLSMLLPNKINSSAKAFKYFGIPVSGRHTALGDAGATMQLYVNLISKIQERTK